MLFDGAESHSGFLASRMQPLLLTKSFYILHICMFSSIALFGLLKDTELHFRDLLMIIFKVHEPHWFCSNFLLNTRLQCIIYVVFTLSSV